MTSISDVQTPEMAAWVQNIVTPMIREQMEILRQEIREDGLGRLERSLDAHRKRTEQRFDRLETALADLAAAQQRTEERVEELAAAQQRTEERVEELAVAQKRTEERVEELAAAQQRTEERVEELAAAQQRTEEQVTQLAATQRGILERLDVLDHRVGLIGDLLGIEAEGEAQEVLTYVLEQKGYRLLEAPYALDVDGEVDVVMRAETPDDQQVWVLVEVKARARLKELRRWSGRLHDVTFQQRLAEAGVTKPFLPYFFGLRVYQIVDEEAERLGIGVLDPNGERVTPALLR